MNLLQELDQMLLHEDAASRTPEVMKIVNAIDAIKMDANAAISLIECLRSAWETHQKKQHRDDDPSAKILKALEVAEGKMKAERHTYLKASPK